MTIEFNLCRSQRSGWEPLRIAVRCSRSVSHFRTNSVSASPGYGQSTTTTSVLQVSPRSSPAKRKYADDDDGRRCTNTVNLVCENGLFFHTSAPGKYWTTRLAWTFHGEYKVRWPEEHMPNENGPSTPAVV